MITLYQVLNKLNYSAEKIQGIAQVVLIENEKGKNSFDTLVELIRQPKIESKQQEWLDKIKPQLEKVTIPPQWLSQGKQIWQNQQIIAELLDGEHFNSLSEKELFAFLVAITQLQFFVSSAKFGMQSFQANFYELDTRQTASNCLVQLFNKLGFCQERAYREEDGVIEEINIHAATEIALTKRLQWTQKIIQQQSKPVTIIYATNPRGISKTEASCAPILASWFAPNDLAKQNEILTCIQAVFADEKNKSLDWYSNLNQLRSKILEKINEQLHLNLHEFPQAPSDIPYAAEYDKAAEAENRDPLDNRWPHIGHLLNFLCQNIKIDLEQVRLKMILVPGKIIGNKYIPAKTWDLIDAFLNDPAQQTKSTLYYVSDNSITFAASRQDVITKILQYNHGVEAKCITYHDALEPEKIVLERLFKEITAELHELFTALPKSHLDEKVQAEQNLVKLVMN